jgi:replication factor C small subunit
MLDVNFLELNASDDRKLETVRTKIKDFVSQGKIGDVPFRIILLDEVDGMTSDAQNALKRIIERYERNARFVFTANDRSRIIYPLQSRCANYFFEALSNDTMSVLIERILEREGHDVPVELPHLIASYNGDLRRVITELQAAIASGSTLKEQVNKGLEEYESIISKIVEKRHDDALNSLYEEVYKGKTVKDICLGLHDVISKSKMDTNTKYRLLRVIGEGEWRSTTMTPRILLSWMIAQTRIN